jgi:hypothetical protein
MLKRLMSAGVLLVLGCAGNPNQIGLYTPRPQEEVWAAIEQKVSELGYTVARQDKQAGILVAERDDARSDQAKEEIQIKVGPDATGVTKLDIVTARVIPGTAERPQRRVAAGSRTTADAHAILNLFMKATR